MFQAHEGGLPELESPMAGLSSMTGVAYIQAICQVYTTAKATPLVFARKVAVAVSETYVYTRGLFVAANDAAHTHLIKVSA